MLLFYVCLVLVDRINGTLAKDTTVDYQNVNTTSENNDEKAPQVTTPIDNIRRSSLGVTPILFLVVLVMTVSTGLKLVLTRDEDVSDEGANFTGFVTRQVG